MLEMFVVVRISTKHINLWMRHLEMKRDEMRELAWLMGFDEIKKEIEKEKDLEAWAKRTTTFFTKKVKRMLHEEIDNTVGNEHESKMSQWCKKQGI